jgi:hypothetical protein
MDEDMFSLSIEELECVKCLIEDGARVGIINAKDMFTLGSLYNKLTNILHDIDIESND